MEDPRGVSTGLRNNQSCQNKRRDRGKGFARLREITGGGHFLVCAPQQLHRELNPVALQCPPCPPSAYTPGGRPAIEERPRRSTHFVAGKLRSPGDSRAEQQPGRQRYRGGKVVYGAKNEKMGKIERIMVHKASGETLMPCSATALAPTRRCNPPMSRSIGAGYGEGDG